MYVGVAANEMVDSYYNNNSNKKLDFKQAIEDYKDEMLTGLTKEEREEIKATLEKYAKENPGNIKGYQNLLEGLMKKFGFKGDIDEYNDSDENEDGNNIGNNKSKASVISLNCDSNAMYAQAFFSNDAKTISETITDTSGDRYIVFQMNNGLSFKMKVSKDSELNDNNINAAKSSIEAYEKNIAFL